MIDMECKKTWERMYSERDKVFPDPNKQWVSFGQCFICFNPCVYVHNPETKKHGFICWSENCKAHSIVDLED